MSKPKICISTCPTGGWVFNNRKRIEGEIRQQHPDAVISHSCACPFTAVVSVDGKKGKRDCLPLMFCCPSCLGCCDAKKYATKDFVPVGGAAGGPEPLAMVR